MDGLRDERILLTLASKMPYGKYKGRRIIDIPEPYLVWMARSGFPAGTLGKVRISHMAREHLLVTH